MRRCYLCTKEIHGSNYMTVLRIGKKGVVIPAGMKQKDVICTDCYEKEKDEVYGVSYYVSPIAKGVTEYSRPLTAEESKKAYERVMTHGFEMIDPDVPYFVDPSNDRYDALLKEYQHIFPSYTFTDTDYIGSWFKRARDFTDAGSYPMRDFELDKLDFLLRNLKDIERHDALMFQRYREKVINALSNGDFYGIRLEIITCSTFIQNHLSFEPIPEDPSANTPDFVIHGTSDVFVECASTHLDEQRQGDLLFKIQRTVKSKSSKSYSCSNTALFLDATNIFYNSMADIDSLDGSIHDDLNKILEDSGFGSIVLSRFLFENRPTRTLSHNYNRTDNKSLDPALKTFLDSNFPLGKLEIEKFFQPPRA